MIDLVVFDFWSWPVLCFIFTVHDNEHNAFLLRILKMPHAVREISLRRTNRCRFGSIGTRQN